MRVRISQMLTVVLIGTFVLSLGMAAQQPPGGGRGGGAPAAGPRHHYTLTLYALNAPLELAANADRAAVMAAMEGKVLARAIFGGRFMQAAVPAPAAAR
jgi:phosphatidylethanolamine-binding protein (PEBP) family uncharacterized protein